MNWKEQFDEFYTTWGVSDLHDNDRRKIFENFISYLLLKQKNEFAKVLNQSLREQAEKLIEEIPDIQNLSDGTSIYGRDNRNLKQQLRDKWLN